MNFDNWVKASREEVQNYDWSPWVQQHTKCSDFRCSGCDDFLVEGEAKQIEEINFQSYLVSSNLKTLPDFFFNGFYRKIKINRLRARYCSLFFSSRLGLMDKSQAYSMEINGTHQKILTIWIFQLSVCSYLNQSKRTIKSEPTRFLRDRCAYLCLRFSEPDSSNGWLPRFELVITFWA